MLNMQQGPIFAPDQVLKFNMKELSIEDMEEMRDQQEILKSHKTWAENHFQSHKAKQPPDRPKIRVTVSNVIEAMNNIAIGKAVSEDRIMDIIFKKSSFLETEINGEKFDLNNANRED